KFLTILSDNYEAWKNLPAFKNNLTSLQAMAKNVTRSIAWEDPEIVKNVTPTILRLLDRDEFKQAITPAILGLSTANADWEAVVSLSKLPNLESLDLSANRNISAVSIFQGFEKLKSLDVGTNTIKEADISILPLLENISFFNTDLLKKVN